jgi:hypothetical protein
MKCLICLDEIEIIKFLPCFHGFHADCINEWISAKQYCPLCKIPISINNPDELNIYNINKNILDDNNIKKKNLYQQINLLSNRPISNGVYENQSNILLSNSSVDNITTESFNEINRELQNILEFENNFNNTYYTNFNRYDSEYDEMPELLNENDVSELSNENYLSLFLIRNHNDYEEVPELSNENEVPGLSNENEVPGLSDENEDPELAVSNHFSGLLIGNYDGYYSEYDVMPELENENEVLGLSDENEVPGLSDENEVPELSDENEVPELV